MAEIVLSKEKIVAEDVVLSTEATVAQTRNKLPFTGTPINAGVIPFTPTETIKERLDNTYTQAETTQAIADATSGIDADITTLQGIWFGPLTDVSAATQYVVDNNVTLLGGESYYDLSTQLFYVWNNDQLLWKNLPLNMDATVSTDVIVADGTATYSIAGGFVASTLMVYLDGVFQVQGVGKDFTADASAGTITFTVAPTAPTEISYISFQAVRLGEYPRITITDTVASLPNNPTAGDVAYVYGAGGANEMIKFVLPSMTAHAGKFLTTDGTDAVWSTLTFSDVETARDHAWAWATQTTGNVNDGVNTPAPSAFQEAERAKTEADRAEAAALGATGIGEAPIDGTPYMRQDEAWVAGETGTPSPTLSGSATGNEGSVVNITIDNYNALLTYVATPSGGSVVRTDATLAWTLPAVTADTPHTLSVTAELIGVHGISTPTVHNTNALNLAAVDDQSYLVNSANMTEMTVHANTALADTNTTVEAVAIDATSNIVDGSSSANTLVSATQIVEGDTVNVDGTDMVAGTVTESAGPLYSIDTTAVTAGGTPTTAYLNCHRVLSNIVTQDVIDTDFTGGNAIATKESFVNISAVTSSANTLETTTPIANGDKLVIVKTDDSFNEVVASGVTGPVTGIYTMDTTATTVGETPNRAYAVDSNTYMAVSGGFVEATEVGNTFSNVNKLHSDSFKDSSDLFLYTLDTDGTNEKPGGDNLVASGTPSHASVGHTGNALTYTATDFYSVTNPLPLTDFSISLWFEPLSADASQIRVLGTTDGTGDNGLQIERDGANKLIWIMWNGTVVNRIDSTNTKLLGSGLSHYVWTYNATSGETLLYVDGVNDVGVNNVVGTTFAAHQADMYVGKTGVVAGLGSGNLDTLRGYNKVLSPSEVSTLFNEELSAVLNTTRTHNDVYDATGSRTIQTMKRFKHEGTKLKELSATLTKKG